MIVKIEIERLDYKGPPFYSAAVTHGRRTVCKSEDTIDDTLRWVSTQVKAMMEEAQ